MDRPAPCELMKNTPLCDTRLIPKPLDEYSQRIFDVVGWRDSRQDVVCERRAGHPGSHYGELPQLKAVWDDELIYCIGRDGEWESFEPCGNYHGLPVQ